VVLELVAAVAQRGDAEDHQLGLAPRQSAAGHEPPREEQPAAEQPPVAPQDQEQLHRLVAADAPGRVAHSQRE
jgi:hypothetical protein